MSNWATRVFNKCARNARRHIAQPCLLCGDGGRHEGLCPPCRRDLPALEDPACPLCATPIPTGGVCGTCLVDPPRFDSVVGAYAYDFPLDRLIHSFKYGGELRLAELLGAALANRVPVGVDLVLPMPLSVARLRERGCNQALELARVVARLHRLPLAADACRRVIDTPPQALLPWRERARNIRGAFVCDADLRGLNVAVVDDVLTTGSTLNELARNLKRAGALAVHGWVVARAVPRVYQRAFQGFE